jgi:hypothetical protein
VGYRFPIVCGCAETELFFELDDMNYAVGKHSSNRSIPGVVGYGLAVTKSTDAGERGTQSFVGDAGIQLDVWCADGMAVGENRTASGDCV